MSYSTSLSWAALLVSFSAFGLQAGRGEPQVTHWVLEGDACPTCGCPMYTDGRWDYCWERDVCGYSRLANEPVVLPEDDDELDTIFDGAGVA